MGIEFYNDYEICQICRNFLKIKNNTDIILIFMTI